MGGRSTAGETTAKADLLSRRDTLYAQLRELDDTRDKLDAPLYAVEREKLLAAAATVLRQLDVNAAPTLPAPHLGPAEGAAAAASPSSASAKPDTFATTHPRLTSMLYGLLAAGVALGMKAGLEEYSRARGANDSITGGTSSGGGMAAGGAAGEEGPQLPPAMQAELDALQVKASADPTNLQVQNDYAHALIAAGQVMDAWKVADAVVKIDKENPEARVHQAVTLLNIGDVAMGTKLLDKVLATTPDQVEALGYRGVLYARAGDRAKAVEMWERAKAADPAEAPAFDQLIARVDQMIAEGAAEAAAPSTGPMSGGGGMGGSASEAAAGPPEFTGEVRLKPGVTGSGTLYIYVRPEGQTAGPPLRVKRLPPEFPATFTISAGDSPMGGALPAGNVQISARLDSDGNVATKDPTDPVAVSAPVAAGGPAIVLELAPAKAP